MSKHFLIVVVIALFTVGVISTSLIIADGDEPKQQPEKSEVEKTKPNCSRYPIHIVMPDKGGPEIARVRVPWGKWSGQWIPLTKMKEGLWICEAVLPPAAMDGELWIGSNRVEDDEETMHWLKKSFRLREGTVILDSVREGKNGFAESDVNGHPLATLYFSYTAKSKNTTSVECEYHWLMGSGPHVGPMLSMGENKWYHGYVVYPWNDENSKFSAVFIETRTAKDGTKTRVRIPVEAVNVIGFAHGYR